MIYLIQGTDLFIKDVMLVMDYVFGFMSFKIGLPGFTSYPLVILFNFFFFKFQETGSVLGEGFRFISDLSLSLWLPLPHARDSKFFSCLLKSPDLDLQQPTWMLMTHTMASRKSTMFPFLLHEWPQ